jgi:hypothetical protein
MVFKKNNKGGTDYVFSSKDDLDKFVSLGFGSTKKVRQKLGNPPIKS